MTHAVVKANIVSEKQLYTTPVEEDSDGELFLTFPDALLNQMGWDPGDELVWEEIEPSQWLLKKKE